MVHLAARTFWQIEYDEAYQEAISGGATKREAADWASDMATQVEAPANAWQNDFERSY